MDGLNRRRSATQLLEVPGKLGVEIALETPNEGKVLPATVDRLTRETVVVTFRSGFHALSVATATSFVVRFRAGDMVVEVPARPGRRNEDVIASHTLELILMYD